MATWNGIPAFFGVGGARVAVYLRSAHIARGETLHGTITITGGKVAQYIAILKVSLSEHVHNSGSRNSQQAKIHGLDVIAHRFYINPGERNSAPFSFVIPDAARLSQTNNDWQVTARADLGWALPQSVTVPIRVDVHREVVAAQEALRSLGFQPASLPPVLFNAKSLVTIAHYTPPDHLREQINRVMLTLEPYGASLVGSLRLYRHEDGVAGHLKALTGGNQQELGFQIPRHDLITPASGLPAPRGAVPHFQRLLSQSLALPDNAEKWLLRAASGPASGSDSLLRPAHATPPETGDELLRPTEKRY